MEIYDSAGTLILSVVVDDDSYRYKAIMGDNELTLKYALAEHVELPLGSYCDYQSERYYLIQPENLKEVHSRDFEYTVTMQTVQAYAKLWKFRNPVDGRLKFPLTAKPKEHLQMFVDNMNSRDKGWTIGECIDGTETLINYDHAYCLDALKQMADTFNTEFEINGRQVSLRKVGYNKQQPLALSYGRGKGFKTGVARENSSNNPPVEILFVQGGTQNIDASKYGSLELMLPADGEIGYDGSKFSDEDGFVSTAARWYKVDSDRRSLRRRDKQLTSRAEDSVDLSSIYPKRVGTISEVVTVDKDKNFYDIIDDTIPDSLDYSACLIDGETMTVIFQSGELSGREFDVKYYPAVKDGKKAKRFEIVPAEQDGQVMPGGTFLPVVGDTYAVFHCQLPQAYINEAKTKSGAEWDMFREAVRYMYEHEETEFTFTGDLDGIWSKKDWENIGGRIKLGGYISFSDARFQKEGVLVRITGIKDYINSPHSPEIELSNKTVSATVGSRLQQLEAASVTVEEKHRDAISFTKRRFRDAQETASMLEKALLDNYTNSINPITVRTMQLLVGDESLQFRFVNSRTAPVEVAHQFTYDKATKQLTTAAGTIQHMTLGIKDLSSQHKPSEYKFWSVNSYTSAVLDEPNKKYYLYIKASKSNETAEFLLSEGAIKLDGMSGYYHFLCGVLNSEYDGERSFATLYGFSEVLPGRVTTDRVVSGDGLSYFDMVANAMKLGDRLRFNVDGDGKLVLNGTLVQRGGEEQPIIMYRGQWLASVAYAVNDVVFYIDSDNKVSSYICIKATTVGVKPTDTEYWETFAQGIKGDHGGHFIFVYCLATQTPTKPNYTQYPFFTLNGEQYWQTTPPSGVDYTHFLYMSYAYVDDTTGQIGAWSSPVRISGENGETGKDGSDIEFIYRRNTINSCAAPTNNASADDYIPTGWTDNPTGVDATYQYEFVCVRVKERGADVWGNFSSPALWAKWGEKGQDGDGVEYIFSRTQFEIKPTTPYSAPQTDEYVPDGWLDEPEAVNSDMPFEWVSIRHKRNGTWEAFSEPQLWQRLSTWNPNLLEQTEFSSVDKMNRWSQLSQYYSSTAADDNITHIQQGGHDGQNYYSDINTRRYNESIGKEVLQQTTFDGGLIRKLQPSTWYTLSFWSRQGANNKQVNETSSNYGFAKQSLYLKAGHTYTLVISGKISSTALAKGKILNVFVYNADWTTSWNVSINSTTDEEQSIQFKPTTTGEYYLSAYLYPDDSDRSTVDYGTVTFNYFRIVDELEIALSYIYPGTIDTTVQGYVDGRAVSLPEDGSLQLAPNGSWDWQRHVVTFKTKNTIQPTQYILFRLMSSPVSGQQDYLHICQPKLEQGKQATAYTPNSGDTANAYQEMRFAKNGSTTAAPALDNTQAEPDGWTVMQPTLGKLEYLWMIVCWKHADGTLKEEWSDPVRITPYDGVDGDSPVMVFRGLYDATKTYYGTKYRVDAVKYQNTYYIARTDAGEFKNVLPTDTSKWNTFGAQFESIATNLLLAEGANIGDWFISGGQIVSTLDGRTLIKLDAKTPKILLQSTQTGGNMGDYNKNMNTAEESTISLDAQNGQVEARSNDGVAYMTANGVFCNHAQTNALPASTGYTHYGSVVGLGFAKVNKSSWEMNEDETIVTGVYGRADNIGTAPSYGGYFNQLKAAGFSKGVYYFTDSDNNHQLSNSNATVVGLVNKGKTNTLYLPRNAHEGEEIEVIQMGQGTVRVDTNDGTHLYDDDSENDYYDIGCGYTGVFRKVKYSINNVTYDIWTVGVYKF